MIDLKRTALIVIDMQRDFCEKNGYADHMGLDVEILRQPITNIQKLLDWARQHQLLVVHTREGHRTDLTDLYSLKKSALQG